ncbi:MAG: hypothetical protein KAH01_01525, partial [Caldisericia bacterium]|nr:hypothetical protein [Caldisericia bacterium]
LEFLKDLIEEADTNEKGSFYSDNNVEKIKTLQGIMDLEGAEALIKASLAKHAGSFAQQMIHKGFTSLITEKMQTQLNPIYNDYVQLLEQNIQDRKDAFERKANGEKNIVIPKELLIKQLPAQVIVDMNEVGEDGIFTNETMALRDEQRENPGAFYKKYGINIMSKKLVLSEDGSVVKVETPNFLTSLVNITHSIDSAINFTAHRRTMAHIKRVLKSGKENGKDISGFRRKQLEHADKWASMQVHDANYSNIVYNTIYEKQYRQLTKYVNSIYDIKGELIDGFNAIGSDTQYGLDNEMSEAYSPIEDTNREERLEYKKNEIAKIKDDGTRLFGFSSSVKPSEGKKIGSENKIKKHKPKKVAKWMQPLEDSGLNSPLMNSAGRNIFNSFSDIMEDNAANQFVQGQIDRVNEILDSGQEFIALDMEWTFNSNGRIDKNDEYQNSSAKNEILEIHLRRSKRNEDGNIETIGKPITIKFNPSDKTKYDSFIKKYNEKTGSSYLASESFASSNNQSDVGSEIESAFKTILNNETGVPILAFNGNTADFQELSSISPEMELLLGENLPLDAAYGPISESQVDSYQEGDIDKIRRRQGDLKEFFLASESSGVAHSAEADVDVMLDTLNKSEQDVNKDTVTDPLERAQEIIGENSESNALLSFFDTLLDDVNIESVENGEYSYDPGTHKMTIPQNHRGTAAQIEGLTAREAFNHELYHFLTAGYLGTKKAQASLPYKYLRNLINKLDGTDLKAFSKRAKKRLKYVLDSEMTEQEKIAEISAIIASEDVGQDILDGIDKTMNKKPTTVLGFVNKLINDAKKFVTKQMNGDSDFSGEQTAIAVANILSAANEMDNQSKSEGRETYDSSLGAASTTNEAANREAINKKMRKALNFAEIIPEESLEIPAVGFFVDTLETVGSDIINNIAESSRRGLVGETVESVDNYLKHSLPLYAESKKRVGDILVSYHSLQQTLSFIDENRVGFTQFLADITTISTKAEEKRGTIDNRYIANMNREMEHLSKKQIADLYQNFSQSPVFFLMQNTSDFNDLVEGTTTVDELITKYEKVLSKELKKRAERTAYILTGKATNINEKTRYNSDLKKILPRRIKDKGKDVGFNEKEATQRLTALYSMRNTGTADSSLQILREPEAVLLRDLIVDASVKLSQINEEIANSTGAPARWRENLTRDIYETNWDLKAVTQEEFRNDKFKTKEGWQVLRHPTKNKPGIMYREQTEATFQHGPGTSLSFNNADVLLDKLQSESFTLNTVLTGYGSKGTVRRKLILTPAEKNQLGLIQNPAESLYRSYSRLLEIQDTQIVRDALVQKGFTRRISSKKQLEDFEADLESTDIENIIWQLKLPRGMRASDVLGNHKTGPLKGKPKYPNIKRRFLQPDKKSSVGGYNMDVDLVRADMENVLAGYKDPVLFENSPELRKMAYVARGMVKMVKIAWTALSPTKILNDSIANTGILTGYGVSLPTIWKYGKRALRSGKEFEELRLRQLDAHMSRDDTLAEKLNKEIEEHDYGFMLQNGLLASINIELFTRDESVVTGVQKDINDLLDKALLNEDGTDNGVRELAKTFMQWGFGVDDILIFAAQSAENVAFLQSAAESIKNHATDLKDKKNAGDVNGWLSEFLATPGSKAVGFGSFLVQQVDQMGRYILIKDLIDKGMDPLEAMKIGREAFIDYNRKMPKNMKLLSDYAVILFPSFWTRTFKVIGSMIARRPLQMAAVITAQEALHINFSILSSNPVDKLGLGELIPGTDGGILTEGGGQLFNVPQIATPFWFLNLMFGR